MMKLAANMDNNIPELAEMETLLKCPICFEFIDTAMIVPQCSHNYCSLCIRRHIIYKNQCPVCSETVTGPLLRNNRLLDQLILLFKAIQTKLKDGEYSCNKPQEVSKNNKPLQTPEKRPSLPSTSTPTTKSTLFNLSVTPSKCTPTKTSPYFCRDNPTPESCRNGLDPDLEIVSYVPSPGPKVQKENKPTWLLSPPSLKVPPLPSCLTSPSSVSCMSTTRPADCPDILSPTNGSRNNVPKVPCPVCGVEVPDRNINLHLDGCLNKDEKKESLRSATAPPRRKAMTKFVYTIMKDKELRKRVAECGLPTDGDRQTLIKRHQELTLRYNAQCDSFNPKTMEEIVKEMKETEKSKSVNVSNTPKTFKFSVTKNSAAKEIGRQQRAYEKEHKSQFAELIAQTRERIKEKKKQEAEKKALEESAGKHSKLEGTSSESSSSNPTQCVQPIITVDGTDGKQNHRTANSDTTHSLNSVIEQTEVESRTDECSGISGAPQCSGDNSRCRDVPSVTVSPHQESVQTVTCEITPVPLSTGTLPRDSTNSEQSIETCEKPPSLIPETCEKPPSLPETSVASAHTVVSDSVVSSCMMPPGTLQCDLNVQSVDSCRGLPGGSVASHTPSEPRGTETDNSVSAETDTQGTCNTAGDSVPGSTEVEMYPMSPSLYSDCASPSSIISGDFTSESTIPYSEGFAMNRGTQPFTTITEGLKLANRHTDGLSLSGHAGSPSSVMSSDFGSMPPPTQPGSRAVNFTEQFGSQESDTRSARSTSPSIDDLMLGDSPKVPKRGPKKRKRPAQDLEPEVSSSNPPEPTTTYSQRRRGRPRLDHTSQDVTHASSVHTDFAVPVQTRRSSRLSLK